MSVLHNKVDKQLLKKRLNEEEFHRTTISFYRYFNINNTLELRDELYEKLYQLDIFGRIYIASEGINAQISVPVHNKTAFINTISSYSELNGIRLNIAVEDDGKSFYKLIIKIKEKIVADGLDDDNFDPGKVGKHLDAVEFNKAIDDGAIVVDMRNHYESEVGHFEGAICPDSDTFKDELPIVIDMLDDKKDEKVLLYCTGGIRCEKASAYLKHQGFKDVNQLYGGIIHYYQEIKQKGLQNKFVGKNFVFDNRLSERISNDIVSQCHQCGEAADTHTNCLNEICHILFIQCNDCKQEYSGCCSKECEDINELPIEEQKKLRKSQKKQHKDIYKKGRIRPKL